MKPLSIRKKIILGLLIASGVATIVICLVMNFALIPKIEQPTAQGNPPIHCFDMCGITGYTEEDAHAFVNWLSPEALHTYLHVQLPLDFFYPIFYTLFFSLLWVVLHGKPNLFLAMPVALAISDYIENSVVIAMLLNPNFSRSLALTGAVATGFKTGLMYLTIFSLVLAIVFCIIRAVRRKRQREAAPDSPVGEE